MGVSTGSDGRGKALSDVPLSPPSPAHLTEPGLRHTLIHWRRGPCSAALGAPLAVPFRTQHPLGAVVNRPSVWSDR